MSSKFIPLPSDFGRGRWMTAGDGTVTVPGKSRAVIPSLWSKDGTDGLGAVPSVLGISRTAHRRRPSDGTVDITGIHPRPAQAEDHQSQDHDHTKPIGTRVLTILQAWLCWPSQLYPIHRHVHMLHLCLGPLRKEVENIHIRQPYRFMREGDRLEIYTRTITIALPPPYLQADPLPHSTSTNTYR